jgi:hypothetical protein
MYVTFTNVLYQRRFFLKQRSNSWMMYFIGIFIVLFVTITNNCLATPLDDYVNTPDPMFSWKRLETYPQSTYTLYILNMTSQQWFDGKIRLYKLLDYLIVF